MGTIRAHLLVRTSRWVAGAGILFALARPVAAAPVIPSILWVQPHADAGATVVWARGEGLPIPGWHVEKRLADGTPQRLSADYVPLGLFDPASTLYHFPDATTPAEVGDSTCYRLVAVDPELAEWPGEWQELPVSYPPDRAEEEPARVRQVARKEPLDVGPVGPGPRMRITINAEGLYAVSTAQIASALQGFSQAQVMTAIANHQLALSHQGEPVAWRAQDGNAGILFFGQAAPRDTYDRKGYYWLEAGPGLAMESTPAQTDLVAANAWFWDTVRAEKDEHFVATLPGDETDDYWVWDGRQLTSPSNVWSWTQTVTLPDAFSGIKTGQVTAFLSSAYDGVPLLDNRTRLLVGGQVVSDMQWEGDRRLEQMGTTTNLGGSSVTIQVEIRRNANVTTTTVLIDALEVRYARQMRARNNQLIFQPLLGTTMVTVRGFTRDSIRVFDVTTPAQPVEIVPTISAVSGTEWQASWVVDPQSEARYLAVATARTDAAVAGTGPAVWQGPHGGAPHVVIASRALTNAANALVTYRQQQGLDSLLVAVEDLFDTFTYGRRDPLAIRLFLAHALANWAAPPAYVCLAGDGHLDYRDLFAQSSTRPNHIPPLLQRAPNDVGASGTLITVGADNPLADVEGDGLPDVAIGRLPAQNSAALTRMINRITQFESSETWKNSVLLVSDKSANNEFGLAVNRLAAKVPAGISIHREGFTMNMAAATMRANFVRAMNAGPLLVTYYGHANNVGIGTTYFFEHSYQRSDMAQLTNSVRSPIVLAGTCMLNNYAQPHPDNRCLGKGFLENTKGGPVGVWASATEATRAMAEATIQGIFTNFFATHGDRLGDLIHPALVYQAHSASPWTVPAAVLLGDPGLLVRTPQFRAPAAQPSILTIPAAGITQCSVAIDASGDWQAVADREWIVLDSDWFGRGNGTLRFDIPSNPDFFQREGTITITGAGSTTIVTIQQEEQVRDPYDIWADDFFTPAELADSSISGRDADPDGDGLSNWQEFLAGTNPQDSGSVLQMQDMQFGGEGITVSWQSVPGMTYQVAVATNMVESAFVLLPDTWLATDSVSAMRYVLDPDASAADCQLYFCIIAIHPPDE